MLTSNVFGLKPVGPQVRRESEYLRFLPVFEIHLPQVGMETKGYKNLYLLRPTKATASLQICEIYLR